MPGLGSLAPLPGVGGKGYQRPIPPPIIAYLPPINAFSEQTLAQRTEALPERKVFQNDLHTRYPLVWTGMIYLGT